MTVDDLLDSEIICYKRLLPDIVYRINTEYYIKIDLDSNRIDLYNDYISKISYKLKI